MWSQSAEGAIVFPERPGAESMWLAWVTKVPSKTQRYMHCKHTCMFDMPALHSVVLAAEELTL